MITKLLHNISLQINSPHAVFKNVSKIFVVSPLVNSSSFGQLKLSQLQHTTMVTSYSTRRALLAMSVKDNQADIKIRTTEHPSGGSQQ